MLWGGGGGFNVESSAGATAVSLPNPEEQGISSVGEKLPQQGGFGSLLSVTTAGSLAPSRGAPPGTAHQ